MHDRAGVDEWIAKALAHSCMPLARRTETAEEWRAHLDQLVRDNRDAGMPDEQAVSAALETFGDPEDLRRRLRRDQRMVDRRAAIAEVRKAVPLFIMLPVVLVVPLFLVVPPASIRSAVIGGLGFVASMLAVSALGTYFGSLLTMRIMRQRPREEFAFLPRWGHWTAVSLVIATAVVWFPIVTIGASYPIIEDLPHLRLGLIPFGKAYCSAMLEDVGGFKTYMAPIMLVVIPLALTLYERSRCIGTAKGGAIQSAA